MSDLISRAAAIEAIVNSVSEVRLHDNSETARYGATFRQHEILDIIDALPAAQKTKDVVEVVRCKDCKHNDGSYCYYSAVYTRPNGYCQWGERKNGEQDG